MIKPISIFLSVFALLSTAFGQKPVKTSNPGANWKIRWNVSDEFNDAQPNWKKWIKSGRLPNTSSWKWDNAQNVTIEDGVSKLTLRHNSGNRPDVGTYFKSGILKSHQTITYGYFEARIKGAAFQGSGVCPSFWLFSDFDDKATEGEIIYCEIDVVELQQFDWCQGHQDDVRDIDLNLHCILKMNGMRKWRRPKDFPEAQLNKWRAPWDPREEFHIYGCEVSEKEIIWYVDGREVAQKLNTHWHLPKHVALSLGLRKPFVRFDQNRNNAFDPETDPDAREKLPELPTSMFVDYVRVWQKEE